LRGSTRDKFVFYIGVGSSSPYSGDGTLADFLFGLEQQCTTLLMVVGVGGVVGTKQYWPPKANVAHSKRSNETKHVCVVHMFV
jgi:hypothetical protein